MVAFTSTLWKINNGFLLQFIFFFSLKNEFSSVFNFVINFINFIKLSKPISCFHCFRSIICAVCSCWYRNSNWLNVWFMATLEIRPKINIFQNKTLNIFFIGFFMSSKMTNLRKINHCKASFDFHTFFAIFLHMWWVAFYIYLLLVVKIQKHHRKKQKNHSKIDWKGNELFKRDLHLA